MPAFTGCPFDCVALMLLSAGVNLNGMNLIFLRALRHQLDPLERTDDQRVFDVEYCTSSGEIVAGKVQCTSSSFVNDTFNFKFVESGEIRTVHASLLLSVNGREVML